MNIVFMGTPDFAVQSLDALINAGHNVAAVFTQPDKPQGRKMILTPPPVKEYALDKGLTVYQPLTLKDGQALDILKTLNPDVIVVVAYGRFLPNEILQLPKYGCVNVHASLLPRWRGASPIQWCIVQGDKVTGVCTQQMAEGMDTGDVLGCSKTDIGENETAEELFDRLSLMGAELIVSTLDKLQKGEITPVKQNEADATYAPIIKKEMGRLDFTMPALELHNLVRGFYSWPSTYFIHDGKRYKVISAKMGDKTNKNAATVVINSARLLVCCGDGVSLEILKIQPEGSRAMSAAEFILGHSHWDGMRIEEGGNA